MSKININSRFILELINEEDFHDISLVKLVAEKLFSPYDPETVREFLRKLRFSFLANDDNYRMQVLEMLADLSSSFSLKKLFIACSNTLVGNYLILTILSKRFPIISIETVKNIIEIIPYLTCMEDVCLFGYPYQEQVILDIDERIKTLNLEEIAKLAYSCNILFNLGILRKSRETVESFQNIYQAMEEPEYNLRARLISSLLQKNFQQFSFIMKKIGYDIETEEQIISDYFNIWKFLEKLSIPVFFDVRKLRYNGTLYNGNFFFLRYKNFEGRERIIYPFSQVNLSKVNKIYDPEADVFYTPRERYGRLLLSDIFSFREALKIKEPTCESIAKVISMTEDEIERRIREILKDANLTAHSPVELADILTLNLFVNNPEDLRLSGFIIKGRSFKKVHLNTIAGQLLQVSHSPIDIVFLVHVHPIDDRALRYFIQECESKQKNYCIINRNDLARIFMAYNMI